MDEIKQIEGRIASAICYTPKIAELILPCVVKQSTITENEFDLDSDCLEGPNELDLREIEISNF